MNKKTQKGGIYYIIVTRHPHNRSDFKQKVIFRSEVANFFPGYYWLTEVSKIKGSNKKDPQHFLRKREHIFHLNDPNIRHFEEYPIKK